MDVYQVNNSSPKHGTPNNILCVKVICHYKPSADEITKLQRGATGNKASRFHWWYVLFCYCFVVVLVWVLLVERNSIRIIVIAFKIIRVDYQNVFCCCCFLLTFFHLHNGLCLFCLRQCLKCNGKLSEQTTLYM